jgi:tetratricopeptide (TPR) repeat protein
LREAVRSRFSWKQCVDSALAGLNWADVQVAPAVVLSTRASAVPTAPVALVSTSKTNSLLEIPQRCWQAGKGLADSQLLRAEELAVPFDAAREPELSKLMQWANDAEYAQALRLVTGSGGTGKTRLALELCDRLTKQGWHCGFVPSEMRPVEAAGAWSSLATCSEPVLAVFDYAETRQDALLAFVKAMLKGSATQETPRVRVLLLARDGGEWWDRLPARDPLCEAFLNGYATSGPFALPPMHQGVGQREAAYDLAVQAYAERMGSTHVSRLRVDLAGEHFGRPLYIQMAALLALHGERPASAEGLTKALLHHERRYWARLLQDTAGVSGLDDGHAAELMTLATLTGGFVRPTDAQQAWRAWTTSTGRELDRARQRALFDRLAALYPGQQGLQPLRPDLLGEALVAHSLLQSGGAGLLDALLGPGNHSAQRRSALTGLARLSNHRPDVEATVVQSLARSFVSCVVDLVNVATQGDSLLPNWAEHAYTLLSHPVRSQAVGLLSPLLQYESVQLAQLACAISSAELEKHKSRVDKKPSDTSLRASYARALMNHAVRLARAGRDALAIFRQSVNILEGLATKNADRFEPDWARSLNNYANCLSENGRYIEALACAQRALDLTQRLVSGRPLIFAEDAYTRNLAVQWFEWLAEDTGTDATTVTSDPDPTWCKPHRLSTLKIYRFWVTACSASGDRQRAIAEIFSTGNGLDAARFRQVEEYWLCAAAWRAAHAAETDREEDRNSQWLPIWRRFLAQRGGQYPRWMDEVAKRLDFVWPK